MKSTAETQTAQRLFIVFITLCLASIGRAQSPPPAPWIQLTVVQVEPAMVDEYLALQREMVPRLRRAGIAWRTVSRTEVFGDSFRFLIAVPLQALATLDAPKPDPEMAT